MCNSRCYVVPDMTKSVSLAELLMRRRRNDIGNQRLMSQTFRKSISEPLVVALLPRGKLGTLAVLDPVPRNRPV